MEKKKLMSLALCILMLGTTVAALGAAEQQTVTLDKLKTSDLKLRPLVSGEKGPGTPTKDGFDILDQSQYEQVGGFWIGGDYQCSQSFTPMYPTLTRVRVPLWRDAIDTGDIVLSIRTFLTEDDLTSATVNSGKISPSGEIQWVEFDFPDITVIPGATYYMNMRMNSSGVVWAVGDQTSYTNGRAFGYYGAQWHMLLDEGVEYDFSFETYRGNMPPSVNMLGTEGSHLLVGATVVVFAIGIDPDGDNLSYRFTFGDGKDSGWLGPSPANQTFVTKHVWYAPGSYDIYVKVKDIHNDESPWFGPHHIIIYLRSSSDS